MTEAGLYVIGWVTYSGIGFLLGWAVGHRAFTHGSVTPLPPNRLFTVMIFVLLLLLLVLGASQVAIILSGQQHILDCFAKPYATKGCS